MSCEQPSVGHSACHILGSRDLLATIDLDVFSIVPTAESWAAGGDRGALCAIYAVDLSKLSGSMRGAAR